MKRLFPLLLCLLLALFPAPRAQGESAALLQSDMPNIRAAFLWEGVPYAFAGNGLHALDGSGEILPIELRRILGWPPCGMNFSCRCRWGMKFACSPAWAAKRTA